MTCLALTSSRANGDDLVVTGTRTPESSHKSVVRTDTVTRAEAERRGATNVGEALTGQLGLQVNPASFSHLGSPSAVQMLGFDLNRVLILEDGERVIGDVGGAIDLSSLPLTDVGRIEIVPGPTSALYGTSALGGVINVLSAAPTLAGAFARTRLEARSYRGALLQGTAGYRAARAWVVADGSFTRRDGVLLRGDRPDLLVPGSERFLASLRAGYSVAPRIDLRVRARVLHDSLDGRESTALPGLGRYVTELPQDNTRVALQLLELIDLGGGSSLRMSLTRQWALAHARKDRRDSPLDELRRRDVSLSSYEATWVHPFGPHTLVAGLRGEAEHYAQTLEKTVATDASGTLATTAGDEVRPIALSSLALYGQLALSLTRELKILGGLRGEAHQRFGAVAAPRLSVFYAPSREWSLRGGLGRGFRAPTGKELGFTFDHSFYGYRVDGDPNVRPESSWGVNGDATLRSSAGATLRAGAFYNWVRDLIDIAATGERTAAGVDVYRYRNIGAARTAGAQVDVVIPARSWFRVELGYAHLWTRDDGGERPLPSRPPHTVTAATRVSLPHGLELYVRHRVVSDAFVDSSLRSPSFQTLDVRLAKVVWPAARAYAGVLNAFDERPTPGRLGDQRPLDGRVFYIGLTAELPAEE